MSFISKVNVLLVTILCIVPLTIIPFMKDYYYLPKIYIIYFLILCIAGLCFLNRSNPLDFAKSSLKLLFAYLLLVSISTLFSMDILCSIWGNPTREEGFFAILSYSFLFILASRYYQFNEKHIIIFTISTFFIAFYGIIQYFGYDPIPRDPFRTNWEGTAFSTLGNPNFLGSYLVLTIPIVIYSYLRSRRKVFFVTCCILYLCLLCTNTRSAWIGMLVCIVLLLYHIYKFKLGYKYLVHILIGFVIITLLFNAYSRNELFGRFLTVFKDANTVATLSTNYENAGSNRLFIWVRVIKLIGRYPIFGVGLENLCFGPVFLTGFSFT